MIDLDEVKETDPRYKNLFKPDDSIESAPVVDHEYTEEELDELREKFGEEAFKDFMYGGGRDEGDLFDEKIEIKNGRRKINVEDLEFNRRGVAYVLYDGFYMEFERGDVDETYNMMLENPKYSYRYLASRYFEDRLDVVFKSRFDGSEQMIRVFHDGSEITGFEVR